MKKNNLGFMLAETLIVASFISATLLYLFIQFRTIVQSYNTSFHYNTVNALYVTNQIKDYLTANNLKILTDDLEKGSVGYIEISKCDTKYFPDTNYCKELMRQSNVNKVIYVSGKNPAVGPDFSKDFSEFIARNTNSDENMYYLLAEFQDSTYGALKMNGIQFPTIVQKIKEQTIYNDSNTVDGLYQDSHSKTGTRYVFRGANPNNYLSFNNTLYRIVAVEDQGVKVIGERMSANKWNQDNNFFTKTAALKSGSYSASALQNSVAFSVLNYDADYNTLTGVDGGYYKQLGSEFQNYILKTTTWYNGTVTNDAALTLDALVTQEVARSFDGTFENAYTGLLNISDFVKASLNANCISKPINNTNCYTNNYLHYSIGSQWLLNASSASNEAWYINSTSGAKSGVVTQEFDIVPVFYLKPTLRLTGSGTSVDPYIIVRER